MKDGDLVKEHLNDLRAMVSPFSSIDIKILDEDKCTSLLFSIPDSWEGLVIAIGSNTTTLNFDEIVLALLSEEMRQINMEG